MKYGLAAFGLLFTVCSLAVCGSVGSTCSEDEYSAGFERIGVLRSKDDEKRLIH